MIAFRVVVALLFVICADVSLTIPNVAGSELELLSLLVPPPPDDSSFPHATTVNDSAAATARTPRARFFIFSPSSGTADFWRLSANSKYP